MLLTGDGSDRASELPALYRIRVRFSQRFSFCGCFFSFASIVVAWSSKLELTLLCAAAAEEVADADRTDDGQDRLSPISTANSA